MRGCDFKFNGKTVLTLSLGLTLLSGFVLRMRMGAWLGGFAAGLDLHRAHSHLGYYGVLFPVAWTALRSHGGWTPGRRSLIWYFAFCLLSFVGFLREGYGVLAIVSSTGILLFWLVFAVKNLFHRERSTVGWLASVPLAVLLSSALIPGVAVLTATDPSTANALANLFLALLMFGIFLPAVLESRIVRGPSAWFWFPLALWAAVDTSGFELGQLGGWGSFAWGLGFLWILFRTLRLSGRGRDPILLAWAGVAVSMILLGLGLLPRSHALSVAGIHFIVLGPLLLGFFEDHLKWKPSPKFQIMYFGSLCVMVGAILGTAIWPDSMVVFQRIAGGAGAALMVLLVSFQLSFCRKRERAEGALLGGHARS